MIDPCRKCGGRWCSVDLCIPDKVTGRKAYQAAYQRKRRAGEPTSRLAVAQNALRSIIVKLDGNDKSLAVEIRAIAQEGLGNG